MLTFFHSLMYMDMYTYSACHRDVEKTDVKRFHAFDHRDHCYSYRFVLSPLDVDERIFFSLSLSLALSNSFLSVHSSSSSILIIYQLYTQNEDVELPSCVYVQLTHSSIKRSLLFFFPFSLSLLSHLVDGHRLVCSAIMIKHYTSI